MFNTEFLHVIRSHELDVIKRYLIPRARLLEIGGGTGIQAKLLAESGFDVVSIDLPQSQYASERVFPVIDYDGRNIPFADGTFDIVVSSNVLEHVENLPALHREIRRILRSDGYCVHVMPSNSWRFWTNLAHYVELFQRIGLSAPRLMPRSLHPAVAINGVLQALSEIARLMCRFALLPPRHGERGNAITEVYYFSPGWWHRHFIESGFDVIEKDRVGLFYTGHMVLGSRLTVETREQIARWFGSACILFKIRPVSVPGNA